MRRRVITVGNFPLSTEFWFMRISLIKWRDSTCLLSPPYPEKRFPSTFMWTVFSAVVMLQISMISLSEYISLYVGSNACTDERKVELLLIITRTNGFFSVDVSLWMWPQCCQWRTHLAGSFSSLGFLFEPHCNGTELEAGMLILTLKAVLGSIW